MNFDKLIDKYIEKPIREKNRVNVDHRLQYKDTPNENNMKLILIGVITFVIIFSLWLINLVTADVLISFIIITPTSLSLIYQYKPRYCKECFNKMIRQQHESSMYYFCDNCKLKLKTVIGTDAGG